VLTLREAPHHRHNVARASFTEVGNAVLAQPAPKFSATPAQTGELTAIGAETDALLDELGYTSDGLDELRKAGAIA
jgi:alpha-methylacyl-CoA racemase